MLYNVVEFTKPTIQSICTIKLIYDFQKQSDQTQLKSICKISYIKAIIYLTIKFWATFYILLVINFNK